MRTYEIDTKNLNENIPKGSTTVNIILKQDLETEKDRIMTDLTIYFHSITKDPKRLKSIIHEIKKRIYKET